MKLTRWPVVGLALLALPAGVGVMTVAIAAIRPDHQPSPPQPWAAIEPAATEGVTARILSAESGVADTSVVVTIDGRPDLGDTANLATGATLLVTVDGRVKPIPSLGRESRGREILIRFPQLQPSATEVRLTLNGVLLRNGTAEPGSDAANVGSMNIPVEVRFAHVIPLRIPQNELPLGASAVIDLSEMARDDRLVVVRGVIRNLAPEHAPLVDLWPTTLRDADGRFLTLEFGRSGFGDGRRHFEFAFRIDGAIGPLELSVGARVDESRTLAPAELIERFAGPPAKVQFSLVP